MTTTRFCILIALALVCGCGGDGGPGGPTAPGTGDSGSIAYVGDRLAVFTAAGQQKTLQAVVLDAGGNVNPSAQVSWQVLDPAVATVAPDGTVTAVGDFGSTLVVASYGDLAAEPATVVIAELAPRARLIDSDDVVSVDEDETRVVLAANERTAGIAAGDVVMSGDKGAVLVTVLAASASGDLVELTTEPAALTRFYSRLDLDVTAPPVEHAGDWTDGGKAFTCRPEGQIDVSVTGFRLRPVFTLQPSFNYQVRPNPADPNDNLLVSWRAGVTGSVGIEIDGGRVRIGGRSRISCKDKLPAIPLGMLPLGGPVAIQPYAMPIWGTVFEAEIEVTDWDLHLVQYRRTWDFATGLGWSESGGLDPFFNLTENGPGATLADGTETGWPFRVKGKAELFGGLQLGWFPRFGPFRVGDVGLFELRAKGGASVAWELPWDHTHRDWNGVRWDLYTGAEVNLKPLLDTVSIAERVLARLGMRTGLAAYLNADLKLIDSTFPLISVKPPSLEVEPEESPGGTGYKLTATVPVGMRDDIYSVDFFAYDPEGPATERTPIGDVAPNRDTGVATVSWSPPDADRKYLVKAVTRSEYLPLEQGSELVPVEADSCPPGPVMLELVLDGGMSGLCQLQATFTTLDANGLVAAVRGPGSFGSWEIVCADGTSAYDPEGDPIFVLQLTLHDAEGRVIELVGTSVVETPDGPADAIMSGPWLVVEGPGQGTSGTFQWYISGKAAAGDLAFSAPASPALWR